jgi:hypothetical protein
MLAGAGLLWCAGVLYVVTMAFTLAGASRAARRGLVFAFVATALAWLAVSISLGVALVLTLTTGLAAGRLLPLHVLAALGGWLTLLIAGAQHRLWMMFTLPVARPKRRLARASLLMLNAGVLLGAPATRLRDRALGGLALLVYAAGTAALAAQLWRMFRSRTRRQVEAIHVSALVAHAWLAVALALLAVVLVDPAAERAARLVRAAVWLWLTGWAGSLVMVYGVRILATLGWVSLHGPRALGASAERLDRLMPSRSLLAASGCYTLGVAGVALAIAGGRPDMAVPASLPVALAGLLHAGALYGLWTRTRVRAEYVVRP